MNPVLLGDFHPVTGARVSGPQWTGYRPPRGHLVRDCDGCKAAIASRPQEPAMAIDPAGGLARLLADPRMTRPLRRLILSVVQAPRTPRRARNERRAEAQLRALGFRPA